MKKYLITFTILFSLGWAQNTIVSQFSKAFADVAEEVNPSVVTIMVNKTVKNERYHNRNPFENYYPRKFFDQEYKTRALGSGVIIDKDNGYILTNNHVVENMDEITVKLIDKREYHAEIVGTDPKSDLAVIQIQADDLNEIKLGDSDILRVGEWVLAIGSPFNENLSHSVTAGIISALGRSHIISNDNYEDFIQTDAAINPGNSGGALVNLNGELIGINAAIATGGFERSNRGVGFAIPINMVKKVMNDLISEGRVIRSWLGVYIQDLDDATARALDLDTRDGALIGDVVKNSPAEKAGIEIGDIITGFDNKNITGSSRLKNVVSSSTPGKRYKVELLRDGKKKKYYITLEELPENPRTLAKVDKEYESDLGFMVEDVNSRIRREYNLERGIEGVVVSEIDRRSKAYSAGLRPGDVIIRVGRKNVDNVEVFYNLLDKESRGNTVLFLVKRGDVSRFLTLEM
ncbi:MAG: DegQ family serine endoprotease [Candidatus Marinimicrobia bacterium]|nr:DegQ family serine endoprotease [Candidatus Neomarinimicrobiota bacterium]